MEKKQNIYREIGELLTSTKKDEASGKEKESYYIKITAEEWLLNLVRTGDCISLENPEDKYRRLLNLDNLSEAEKLKLETKLNTIPKFVKKRLVAKFDRNEFDRAKPKNAKRYYE